jgi:hypothetical protein
MIGRKNISSLTAVPVVAVRRLVRGGLRGLPLVNSKVLKENPAYKPKTFDNYFVFFENRSKNMANSLKMVLLAGIVVNVLLMVLLACGIIHVPKGTVQQHPTPAPEPAHFLKPPKISIDPTPLPAVGENSQP